MTELKFVPEDWCDEQTAEPQPSPNNFIARDGTSWKLRPADEAEAEEEEWFPHIAVVQGDIVQFCEHRSFGTHTVDIDADGNWTVSPAPPTYANLFALTYNWESTADTISELIECNRDEFKPDSSVDIGVWWWSGHASPWQFTVNGDTASFVKMEGNT